MLGTTPPAKRLHVLVSLVAVAIGMTLAAAACSSSNDAASTATIAPTSSTHLRAAAAEAWCKKLDELPNVVGTVNDMQPSDFPKLVQPFTELRDTAPPEVKVDFETLLQFIAKADASQKAGTFGTSQAEMAQWATENFGVDGVTKFKDALTHILTVQANNC